MKFRKSGYVLGVEVYGAVAGSFSFIITCNETGYAASYKDRFFKGKQSSHFIEGSPFRTYIEAEKACKAKWKQLRVS